jgi:predicted N-acetyltransferase YhbS
MAAELVRATGALLEQILDETHPLWGEGLDRQGYARYNRAQFGTPWGVNHLRRVALVENGRLLATAKRYDLSLRIDGSDVDAIGLGAVFTPAALRRRGHAAELIRRMLDEAAARGGRFAVLFSEIAPRYYEHLGFRQLPLRQLALDVLPGRRPGAPAIALRAGERADTGAIVGMNATQTSRFRFTMARDAAYVGHAIARKRLLAACGRPGHRRVEYFVVEEGGRPAAYVVVLQMNEFWMVTECGDIDPSGARVGAILQALLARDPGALVHVRAWLPPGFLPPQVAVLAVETPPIAMMFRPIGRQVWPDPPLGPADVAWWHADAF